MDVVFDKENDAALCPYCNEVLYLLYEGLLFCPDCEKDFSSLTYHELDKDGDFIYEE